MKKLIALCQRINHDMQHATIYIWSGLDKEHLYCRGHARAHHATDIRIQLEQQGIVLLSLKKFSSLFLQKRLPPLILLRFTHQLATLLAAGIPLVQSLELIKHHHSALGTVIPALKTQLERGISLADSLRQHPHYFNTLYCNMIALGEQSGTLDQLLFRLARDQEKAEQFKKNIKTALRYPLILASIAFSVTSALLIGIVPQFAHLFAQFNTPLPIITQYLLAFSHYSQQYLPALMTLLISFTFILRWLILQYPLMAYAFDALLLQLPLLRDLLKKILTARIAYTLSITLTAGISLSDALILLAQTLSHRVYQRALINIQCAIAQGHTLHHALESTRLFSPFTLQLIYIGEQTGTLDTMLAKLADTYEKEVQDLITTCQQLLEPALMSILGIVVGGLLLALYLPIFKLGSVIH